MPSKLELVTDKIVHHQVERAIFRTSYGDRLDLSQFISAEKLFPRHLPDSDQQLVLKVARGMKLSAAEQYRLRELANNEFCSQYFDKTDGVPEVTNLFPTRAYDLLLDSNIKYILAIMKNFRDVGIPKGDLLISGQMGLLTALKKFDFAANTAISTYARIWIRKEIWYTIVNEARTVRIPVNYHPFTRYFVRFTDQGLDLEAALSNWKHTKKLGLLSENEFRLLADGTDEQKQEALSKAKENWKVLAANSQIQISLDIVLGPDTSDETVGSRIIDDSLENTPESVLSLEAEMEIREEIIDILFHHLNSVHVWVVLLAYFSDTDLNYRAIEKRLGYKEGVGPATVSSILARLRSSTELQELYLGDSFNGLVAK